MERRTDTLAMIVAGLLTVLLSGCGATALETSGPGAAAETVAPVETTSAADAPTADPAPPSVTCDAVLTVDEYARLSSEGLALDDEPYLLGSVMERMAAADALVCVWSKPNSDVSAWYARLDVGDEGEAWLTELEADGWLEDTERGDGTYLAPVDYDSNYQPSVQFSGSVLHFASYNRFLESVLELR